VSSEPPNNRRPAWLQAIAGGGFSGISIGLFITANRMLGAWR
jgi:hypothetical protein